MIPGSGKPEPYPRDRQPSCVAVLNVDNIAGQPELAAPASAALFRPAASAAAHGNSIILSGLALATGALT